MDMKKTALIDKVNKIFKEIDKSLYLLINNIYTDEEFITKYYVDTYYTKEMLLDKLILDIRNEKPKFNKLRENILKDSINFAINKGILEIKDNFKENLNKLGILPVTAYLFSNINNKDFIYYNNIYIESLKDLEKIENSIKRYHYESNEKFAATVSMYNNFISKFKDLELENKKLKEDVYILESLLKNLKINDIEEDIILSLDEKKDIIKPDIKLKKVIRIGGYNNNDENIEHILVEDAVRYKEKIKNADYIIFDTKRNSHSVFYMVKKLNKNIILK